MNKFVLNIYEEHDECTFYTVTKSGSEKSEVDDFLDTYEKEYEQEISDLFAIMDKIGQLGAIPALFNRDEIKVHGLPPKLSPDNGKLIRSIVQSTDFPLRLYSAPIGPSIVILFNGGIKDNDTAQGSAAEPQFDEANSLYWRIKRAITQGEIEISYDKLYLIDLNGNTDNIEIP